MTTHDQIFEQIERRYLDAVGNYYLDMAKTRTPEESADVDAQYVAARNAYNDAMLKRLVGNSSMIEQTLESLKGANEEIDRLRREDRRLAEFLSLLGQAASLATRLVLLAG